jgi:hypothetical protein
MCRPTKLDHRDGPQHRGLPGDEDIVDDRLDQLREAGGADGDDGHANQGRGDAPQMRTNVGAEQPRDQRPCRCVEAGPFRRLALFGQARSSALPIRSGPYHAGFARTKAGGTPARGGATGIAGQEPLF